MGLNIPVICIKCDGVLKNTAKQCGWDRVPITSVLNKDSLEMQTSLLWLPTPNTAGYEIITSLATETWLYIFCACF